MGYSVLKTDLRCVYRAVEFDLDLGYDKTILTYHLRYVKLSCVTPSRQFGVPYKIYLGVLGITLQETNMEPSEKFAFTVVVLLGMFYIAFPFINWEYKNLVLQVHLTTR